MRRRSAMRRKIRVTVVPSRPCADVDIPDRSNVEFISVAHSIPRSARAGDPAASASARCCTPATGRSTLPTPTLRSPTELKAPAARTRRGGRARPDRALFTNAVRDRAHYLGSRGRARPSSIWSSPPEGRVAVDDLRLQRRAHQGRRCRGQGCRSRGRRGRPRHGARGAGRARDRGYLDGVQNFRSPEVYGHLPQDKVLALCTGSQGEPRAALARIATMTIIPRSRSTAATA